MSILLEDRFSPQTDDSSEEHEDKETESVKVEVVEKADLNVEVVSLRNLRLVIGRDHKYSLYLNRIY